MGGQSLKMKAAELFLVCGDVWPLIREALSVLTQ